MGDIGELTCPFAPVGRAYRQCSAGRLRVATHRRRSTPRGQDVWSTWSNRSLVNARHVLVAFGAGLTTALVAGGAVTMVLAATIEFSSIVGLPVGLLAGLAGLAGVLVGVDRLASPLGWALAGYATVGFAVLAWAALSYANVAGIRGALSVLDVLVVGVVAGALVAVGLWVTERADTP